MAQGDILSVSFTLSDDLRVALANKGSDPASTWRRSVENRMRPRFNALADTLRGTTAFQSIAGFFRVRQESSGGTTTFLIENTHQAARYLLARGGVGAHIIIEAPHVIPLGKLIKWTKGTEFDAKVAQKVLSLRQIVIPHPGIAEDAALWYEIDDAVSKIEGDVSQSLQLWSARLGAMEV